MTAKKISKKEKNESKIYRLWWEYLKRNDKYKEFCDFIRERKKKCSEKRCFGLRLKHETFQEILEFFVVSEYIIPVKNNACLKDKKQPDNLVYLDEIFSEIKAFVGANKRIAKNYLIFGDVHTDSFELWLNTYKKQLEGKLGKGVEFYNPKKDIDLITAILKDSYECEPSLDAIHGCFIASWDGSWKSIRKSYICLNIDLSVANTTENLLKQIGKIIKEKRCAPDMRLLKANSNLQPSSNTKIKDNYVRLDELARYLQVFDLHTGYGGEKLKMPDIIKRVKPKANNKDVNVQRAFYLDLERAKKIIKNVELGVFPGEYQPGGTKGLKTKT